MKKLNLLLSSLLLILAFTVDAKSPPPGTGKADVPANILIMLDVSGSMSATTNSSTRLYYPVDVAVDSKGNVFVAEYYYHRIKKYDSSGNLLKTIGGYGRNNGRFRYPRYITIDQNDNIYISDFYNDRVQKLTNDGKWLRNYTGLPRPQGVAVDVNGNVYAPFYNWSGRIIKWDNNGSYLTQWPVRYAHALSIYNGTVYAAIYPYRKVAKYSDTGADLGSWSTSVNNVYPIDIEVNSNGVYIANQSHYVEKYSVGGTPSARWGGYGTGNSNFRYIHGIDSDSSGNIYVADFYNHAIKKFDSSGTYISSIGGDSGTRLADAKKVIKKIVSNSDLTKGANFGLMEWASRAPKVNVPVSSSGASQIYNMVDSLRACSGPAGCGTNLDNAMRTAQSYLSGSSSPIDPKASCQKTFLIVISDGYWYDRYASKIAEGLYKSRGIKTFAIGFHTGGNSNYTKLAKAGGTYPDSPLYSSNWQHLSETLSSYIRQAISSSLTFNAPVVMPDIKSGDHIYQSTFTYKKNHQWKGKLTKYQLKSDGTIGNSIWEAGKKLDAKSESSRQIWTIANNVGISTSLNNFSTTNIAGLKQIIWENSGKSPTDTEGTDLINFVRGIDAYDEDSDGNTTENRWKLGDIYHSRLAVVGAPNADTTNDVNKADTEAYYRYQKNYANFKGGNRCGIGCPSRKEVVYVGANDGMLHAFDSKTGAELWAFIPPTMLQSLRSMVSAKANSSHSIYGVDGSPVVKDIYYGNRWRTVLLAGMGRGGHGYFALDITNPNSPLLLFAFQNDAVNKQIYHWDDSGNRSDLGYAVNIPAEYDYSKLGEAWSTPTIMAMPYGSTRKWVAVFGAGFNGGVNTDYGSAVYVIDLENKGKVLKKIDLTDVSNNIANAVPATLTAITPDTTSKAKYKGAMFYFADLEGKFWKLNLTNKGTLYEITQFFNAEATQENDRMAFFQATPSIGNDGNLWMYYGTGNQQKLQRMSSSIKNRIYGFKDADFPKFKAVSSSTITSLKNNTSTGGICPTSADLGWYVDLDAHEKVTGKLALSNETVFATRYTPNNKNICNPGDSILTEHNFACGNTLRGTKLGQGIATGAVVHKGKVYIGISSSGSEDIKDEKGNIIGQRKDNLIVFTPKQGSKGKGSVSYESWREVF